MVFVLWPELLPVDIQAADANPLDKVNAVRPGHDLRHDDAAWQPQLFGLAIVLEHRGQTPALTRADDAIPAALARVETQVVTLHGVCIQAARRQPGHMLRGAEQALCPPGHQLGGVSLPLVAVDAIQLAKLTAHGLERLNDL